MQKNLKDHQDDNKIVLYWNWKSVLTTICAIILTVVFTLFLFTFCLKNTVINPDFYKNNLHKADTYNRIINEGIPSLIMQSTISENTFNDILIKKAVIYVLQKSIPSQWVESQVNKIIDSIATFLSSPQKEFHTDIDLDQTQLYLTQTSNSLILLSQIIPSCEKTNDLKQEKNQLPNTQIDCEKMSTSLDEIKEDIELFANKVDLIANYNLNISQKIKSSIRTISNIKIFIKDIGDYMWISLFISLILIVTIILLQIKNIYKSIEIISLAFIVSATIFLLAALITNPIVKYNLTQDINFIVNPDIKSIITETIEVNVKEFYNYIKLTSIIAITISLIAYFVSYFLNKERNSK